MKGILATGTAVMVLGLGAGVVLAQQQPPPPPRPYYVGNPIGVPAAPPAPTATNPAPFVPMSDNVKVYGGFRSAEACQYDPVSDLVVVTNMGIGQNLTPNDAWITLLNHDGSVHTPKWIGVQGAGNARGAAMETPLVLNQPFGIDIMNGTIYVADRDGGIVDTTPGATGNTPSVAVVRMFDAVTGAPTGEVQVPGSTGLNDLAVAADGTVYGTNTGGGGATPDPTTWVIWKIAPDGTVSIFAQGEPMRQPNGVAIDPDGNIVVVNIGSTAVVTYAPDGTFVRQEEAAMAGNDGLVIMPDGTKYVSSVTLGGVSMIPPGGTATLIATGIPSAASMCYDPTANTLFIPMNQNNAVALIPLGM